MKLEESTITAYLLGELDPAETEAVREAIAADDHWQQVVRDYEKLLTGFREEKVNRYAAEVVENPPPPAPSSSGRPWLWVLLTLVVIVPIVVFWPGTSSPEALAREYFILPKNPAVAGGNDAAEVFQTGLNAFFNDRDYAAATAAFSELGADTRWSTRSTFYLGHAWFMQEEYGQAEAALELSLRQPDDFSRFEQQDLTWNVLMARLAQGEDVREELMALPERPAQQRLLQELEE